MLESDGKKEEDIEAVSNDEDEILVENSADENSYLRKRKIDSKDGQEKEADLKMEPTI